MVEREGRPGQVAANGEESTAGVVSREGRLGEAGELLDEGSVRVEGPRGRVLWQFPATPGRQREQVVPLLTQAHLKHFAVPLHRQQRRG